MSLACAAAWLACQPEPALVAPELALVEIPWKIHWEIHWKIHWKNNVRHRKRIGLVAKITLDTANLFVT